MKKKSRIVLPFPKSKLQEKDQFASPWLFLESEKRRYPFPLPEVEFYPDLDWPLSLCENAPECPIKDDFQDLDPVGACLYAIKNGCPLYLKEFDSFDEFGECKEIPVFEIGQVESKNYTEKDLDQIIANFSKLQNTHRPPIIVLGHDEDQEFLKKSGLPSAGWVSRLWRKGKILYADVKEIPSKVVSVIKSGAYKYPSVEIYRNFVEDGKNLGHVLRRIAFLGADIPRIKSLDDIVARYGEVKNDEGELEPMCLPVVQLEYFGEENNETLWLGGNHMDKVTVSIKDVSGAFKIGEEIMDKAKSKVLGKLEEMAEDSLVITLTAKGGKVEGEISGKDSGATATIGEPEKTEYEEAELDFYEPEGVFQAGEKIIIENTDISAVVKNAEASRLIVLVTPDMLAELRKTGQVIVGQNSKAKAKIGKYPYPYKKPEEKGETDMALKQLQEDMSKLTLEMKGLKDQNKDLKTLAENQGVVIQKQERERTEEKRGAHIKEVQMWAEGLKKGSLAPAFVDEGGLMPFALAMNWDNPVQFAEGEEKKTPWEAFSELMDTMVKLYSEKTLFVPLGKLDRQEGEEEEIPEGIDKEGLALDREVQAYAEEHKVAYAEAFDIVYHEKTKPQAKKD